MDTRAPGSAAELTSSAEWRRQRTQVMSIINDYVRACGGIPQSSESPDAALKVMQAITNVRKSGVAAGVGLAKSESVVREKTAMGRREAFTFWDNVDNILETYLKA